MSNGFLREELTAAVRTATGDEISLKPGLNGRMWLTLKKSIAPGTDTPIAQAPAMSMADLSNLVARAAEKSKIMWRLGIVENTRTNTLEINADLSWSPEWTLFMEQLVEDVRALGMPIAQG